MRISDWSSDVCSSDLARRAAESLADAACALAVAGMSANAEHVVTSVVIFRFIGSPFREPSGPMNGLYEDNVTIRLRLCDAFMATITLWRSAADMPRKNIHVISGLDRKRTLLNSSH